MRGWKVQRYIRREMKNFWTPPRPTHDDYSPCSKRWFTDPCLLFIVGKYQTSPSGKMNYQIGRLLQDSKKGTLSYLS